MANFLAVLTTAIYIALLLSFNMAEEYENEDDEVQFFGREYYDPDDMFNFNQMEVEAYHSKDSLKDKLKRLKKHAGDSVKNIGGKIRDSVLKCDYTEYEKNITRLQKQVEDCKQEKKTLFKKMTLLEGDSKKDDNHTPVLMPYFKRYVLFVQDQFAEQSTLSTSSEYVVRMSMNEESRAVLNRFVNPEPDGEVGADGDSARGSVQDVFFALENMVLSVELMDSDQLLYEEAKNSRFGWIKEHLSLYNVLLMLFMGSMCRIALSLPLRFSWLTLMWRSTLALFVISVPWNWWHLYMIAVARRNRELLKDVPSDCVNEADQGFWSSITSAFRFTKDECAEYHVKLAVDPLWEITPSMAIAVTLTKTVTEPLELVSKGMSRFIRGALEDLPVHLQPPVFVLCVVIIVLMLIMFSGYNIRLFHFFRIEEAPRQPGGGMIQQLADIERDKEIQERDAQIQSLQARIQRHEQQTRALEGEREELEGENQELKDRLKKQMLKQMLPQSPQAIDGASDGLHTGTQILPPAVPEVQALTTAPEAVGVQDVGPINFRPKQQASTDGRSLEKQQDQFRTATVGPQQRISEQADDSFDETKPDDDWETPLMIISSSANSSPSSTPTQSKSFGYTSPVATIKSTNFSQTSRLQEEEDEDDNVDIYSPSIPVESATKTNLTMTRPQQTKTSMVQQRDDSNIMSQNERLRQVDPMTYSTDQYSERNISEGAISQLGPSCLIESGTAVGGIGDEHSLFSSAEQSSRCLSSTNQGSDLLANTAPALAISVNTSAASGNSTDTLSGSWVGVQRDGVVEEGQGDASAQLPETEDSDDGIVILEESSGGEN